MTVWQQGFAHHLLTLLQVDRGESTDVFNKNVSHLVPLAEEVTTLVLPNKVSHWGLKLVY
jgi:hypothetical protein